LLADASVARNFAVLGWIDELVALAGGTLHIAHGVLGLSPDETGEIERIRAAFDSESIRSPGSPAASAAVAALVGIDDLIRRRSHDITVLVPTQEEIEVAVRLQDPKEGAWRQSLGVRARRLDAGEAVSIGIATARVLTFASDDDDGRAAYLALGGPKHLWTLDLVQEAAAQGLLTDAAAREGYQVMCERYRFWGQPWP
jgi:nucleotide-binding universal stress UspA family protein